MRATTTRTSRPPTAARRISSPRLTNQPRHRRHEVLKMGLFDFIAQGCQSLARTAAPSLTAMGIHIVIALATIMLVWFGVQEALASAQGGPGVSIGELLLG